MIKGISPLEDERNKRKFLKYGQSVSLAFLMICFLPFIIYFLYYFGLLESAPQYSKNLEMPVAFVNTGTAAGSAFLVGEKTLLTANHVVHDLNIGDEVELIFEKANPQIVTKARIVLKGQQEATEPESFMGDFAVLELVSPGVLPEDFPRLVIGDSDGIGTRERVIVIGYPGGLMSTTSGTISNDELKGLDIFQLDVGAWQGSSGGPLILEETEEVIGILVAGLTEEFQGINFATKINNVMKALEDSGYTIQ